MRVVVKRPCYKPFTVECDPNDPSVVRLALGVPHFVAIQTAVFDYTGLAVCHSGDERDVINFFVGDDMDLTVRGSAIVSRVIGGRHVEMTDEDLARALRIFEDYDGLRSFRDNS